MPLWGKKKSPQDLHNQAVEAFETGDYRRAIDLFTQVVDLEPNSERYYYRGVLCDMTGNSSQAIKDLNKAVSLDSRNSQAYYSLSIIHAQLENVEGAYDAVATAYSIAPDDFRIANHFAMLMVSSPIREHQNPTRAVEISMHACELTNWEDELCTQTYKSALAKIGDVEKAKEVGETVSAHKSEDLTFEIISVFEKRFSRKANELSLQNILTPSCVSVAVQTIESKDTTGLSVIFTTGSSSRSMSPTNVQGEIAFCEMMMFIPGSWKIGTEIDSRIWPWHTLQQFGHLPHLRGKAYTFLPQVVTPASQLEPLGEDVEFSACLLLPNVRGYVEPFQSESGRVVNFVTVMPIYVEEFELGAKELFKRVRESKTKPHLIPNRPNLATLG